jgi:hypothetical protein
MGTILPSYAESRACVPCLRRSGFAQAGEAHFGAQARVFRPWLNAWRVPYEAHTSVVGYASEGSALRSMWRSHACVP